MLLFRRQSYPAVPEPGDIEFAIPASATGPGGAVRAYSTPNRYAFMRVICTDISGPLQPVPATAYPEFKLRYAREMWTGPVPEVFEYTDQWLVQFFKQMALAVNPAGQGNVFRYRLLWSDPAWLDRAMPTTEIRVGEMQVGDSVLLGLEGYASPAFLAFTKVDRATSFDENTGLVDGWESMKNNPAQDLATLMSANQTEWYPDPTTGILWLKIVANQAPGARHAITMNNDGFGQVIKLER